MIGKQKHDGYKARLSDISALEEEDQEIIALIREACVYYSLSWAIKMLRVSLLPEGILQKHVGDRMTTQAKKVPENMEAELVSQEFARQSKSVMSEVQRILSSTLPEATEEDIADIINLKSSFDSDDDFVSI